MENGKCCEPSNDAAFLGGTKCFAIHSASQGGERGEEKMANGKLKESSACSIII